MKHLMMIGSILLFWGVQAKAQTEKYLLNAHKLLENSEQTDIKRDFYVSAVWDNRLFKDNVGFVQTGMSNKRVIADFEGKLSEVLTEYLNQTYPQKEGQTPIEIVVQSFWIRENTTSTSEMGRADVSFIFCKKDEQGNLNALFSVQDYVENSGLDVTLGHPKRIRKVLNQTLTAFQHTDWQNLKQPEIFRFQTLDSTNNILTTHLKKKGAYKTFQEFYNNIPSDTTTLFSMENIDENRVKLIDPNKAKRQLKLYGYCDGETVYLNANNYSLDQDHYAKIQTLGRYSLINDKTFPQTTSFFMAMGFGALGYLASTGMKSKMEAVLDTKTGMATPLSYETMKVILEPYPSYWRAYDNAYQKGNRSTKIMKVFIDQLNKEYDISIGKLPKE